MRPSGPRPKGWPDKGHLPCRTGSRGLRTGVLADAPCIWPFAGQHKSPYLRRSTLEHFQLSRNGGACVLGAVAASLVANGVFKPISCSLAALDVTSYEIEAICALDDLRFHLNRAGFLCGPVAAHYLKRRGARGGFTRYVRTECALAFYPLGKGFVPGYFRRDNNSLGEFISFQVLQQQLHRAPRQLRHILDAADHRHPE